MPACVFNHLPLNEVGLTLRWTNPNPVDSGVFDAVREKAKEDFDSTIFAVVGAEKVFHMISGNVENELRMMSQVKGMTLAMASNFIEVKWMAGSGIPYPKFGELFETITKISSTKGVPFTDVVTLQYSLVDRIARSISDCFCVPGMNSETNESLIELNMVQRIGRLDHRIQCAPLVSGGLLLNLTGGTNTTSNDLQRDAFETVHDPMQGIFAAILSDAAKERWGYVGIE